MDGTSTVFPRGGSLQLTRSNETSQSFGYESSMSSYHNQHGNLFSLISHNSELFTKKPPKERKNIKRNISSILSEKKSRKFKKTNNSPLEANNIALSSPFIPHSLKSPFVLRLNNLGKGVVCLGIVVKVTDITADIALPNRLIGTLSLEDISDEHKKKIDGVINSLKSYLNPGQRLICSVVNISKNKNGKDLIRLSSAASVINKKRFFFSSSAQKFCLWNSS